MAQLTVRGVDDELIKKLKLRAAQNGRSAEAEHRAILQDALGSAADEDVWAECDRLRDELKGRWTLDSSELVRQSREERTKDAERWLSLPRRR